MGRFVFVKTQSFRFPFSMPTRRPKIGVQMCGVHFPRFIIANDHQQYWNGEEWISNRGQALLYADIDTVREDLKQLKRRRRKQG